MAEQLVAFRLPLPGAPRAVFETDYGLRQGRLLVDGTPVLHATTRAALENGVEARHAGHRLRLQAPPDAAVPELWLDDQRAPREDELRAPTSRSAWLHGLIAFAASLFGFAASAMYWLRAHADDDPWSLKMAVHMAAWHLLLVLTLFPASAWGGRLGIRAVQLASLVFFAIHLGIALANGAAADGPALAVLNAGSGLFFLAAVGQGQTAYRDMDPLRGLAQVRPIASEPHSSR